jgi:hypothetical protein
MTGSDIDEARMILRCLCIATGKRIGRDITGKIAPLLDELERLRESKVAVLEWRRDEARALAPGEVVVPAEDLRAAVAWMDAAANMVGTMGPLGELKTRLRGLVEEGEA